MADDTDDSDSGSSDTPQTAAQKKKDKQTHMLIIIGVVGLVLTYFILRSQSSSSSGTTTANTTADPYAGTNPYTYYPADTSGYSSASPPYNSASDPYIQSLAAELQTVENQMAGISPAGSTTANGTSSTAVQSGVNNATPSPAPSSAYTGIASPSGATSGGSATLYDPQVHNSTYAAGTLFGGIPLPMTQQVPPYITPQTQFAAPGQVPTNGQLAAGYNPSLLPYAPVSGPGIQLD